MLTYLNGWLAVNKLSLSANNAKMMIFRSTQIILKHCEIPNVMTNDISMGNVTHIKCLGVNVDCNITCSSHFNYTANKLSKMCGIISSANVYF